MSNANHYDVIIIGSGAGGGTMARALAPTGKQILILERGGFVPREPENWSSQAVAIEKRYAPGETWYFDDKPFRPGHPHYFVGGSTKLYGAALIRLRERDFEEVEHAGGISPAWPITYAELEPYYLQAEQWYYVHGEAGLDPTEPRRSQPFPYPPLPYEPRIQQLHDDLKRLGYHPSPLPMGVKLGDEDREPGPITTLDLIRNFDGYPDPTESKADAHVVGIKQALKYDNVTLKTHSTVERLETDGRGRNVTGVVVKNGDGSEVVYSTDWVIVAAGAINSAALFLRSKNDSHPNGLANSSGLVGRNYVEAHDRLTAKLKSLLSYIGCHERLIPVDYYLGTQFPFNLAHQMGTMKLGTDPRRSVLDTYCRPHDLENVFVSDGSFFVSSGAVNPTLTIIAQTLRVADFIKRQVL